MQQIHVDIKTIAKTSDKVLRGTRTHLHAFKHEHTQLCVHACVFYLEHVFAYALYVPHTYILLYYQILIIVMNALYFAS